MFAGIATVLAVLLAIGLAVTGLPYLGHRMELAQGMANLEQYTNQYAQITGGLQLYQTEHDGALPSGTSQNQAQTLIDAGYLKNFPHGHWLLENGTVYRVIANTNACRQLNDAANLDLSSPEIASYHGCPPCDDTTYQAYPGCVQPNGDPTAPTSF